MSAVPELRITLAGTERVVAAGTTAGQALEADGRTVIAALVNGEPRDLTHELADGDVVEEIRIDSEEGRAILRHSCAHVLAQAVQELFPEAKLGIGPPIENGFYYDFDVAEPFTPDDLKRIEKRMQEIIKQGQRFSRRAVTDEDARAELADEPYKLELIELKGGAAEAAEGAGVEVGAGQLTIYDNLHPRTGEVCWKDLCRGPHLPDTRAIPAFKLMRTAAAYWRGSEKNPQLQRIYGTAWETKDALKSYLTMLEEAAKRDHRKLGVELDLFSFPDELGSGLAVFHPKGGVVRKVMEEYSRRRHEEAGYQFVNTPHISKAGLFETSGHLPNYADAMFPPIQLGGGRLLPQGHELPYAQPDLTGHGAVPTGASAAAVRVRHGLPVREVRRGARADPARGFTQDDAYIYCTKEQMPDELDRLLTFVLDLLRDYGLSDFYLELSTRDDSPKFIGEPQEWEEATEILRQAAQKQNLNWSWTRRRGLLRSGRSRCRPRTPSAGPGRCPPSKWTSSSPSASS